MNYNKIYDAFTYLFPKTITVLLLDQQKGNLIGTYQLEASVLPGNFSKPVFMNLGGKSWRVAKAECVSSGKYLTKEKWVLHVFDGHSPEPNRSLSASITQLPEFTSPANPGQEIVVIPISQWLDTEFLPSASLERIEQEMAAIKRVTARQSDPLLGFDNPYLRKSETIIHCGFLIKDLTHILQVNTVMQVCIPGYGLVCNSFAFRSRNDIIYYGIEKEGRITHLSIVDFEYIDEDCMRLLANYQLLLVNWPGEKILGS